ncbi:PIG-H domain-containing protein [Rhizoctonia solani AG-1 IA]|uniref:PIG-H domain-containing protein n=1 Tax=Thanatephorus cucumeris (strain AG1-IA) TaxID=983506 RepID=L8WVZ8_THACA|nr:PIG-H domain-containing protein [Rhizoctonia solani AG-1 IA]
MSSVRLKNENSRSKAGVLIKSRGIDLVVKEFNGGIVEYRVKREPITSIQVRDGVIGAAVAFLAFKRKLGLDSDTSIFSWAIALGVLLVAIESIFVFPSVGIQLETCRGLVFLGQYVLSAGASRYFLPLAGISDIVINEGLCGWNVRRYLAVLSAGESRLHVVFQNIDPPFPVLKEVYHGLRETLFDEWDEEEGPTQVNQGKDVSRLTHR